MIALLSDVYSKKPHLRCAGGVWSCVTYRMAMDGLPEFRMGMGYSWREAFADWKKQELA